MSESSTATIAKTDRDGRPAAEPHIRTVDLSVRFGSGDSEVAALSDVSIAVERGEFVSIVGESGCGKTTLLRVVAGLVPATEGRVTIGDRPVSGPSPEIGFVFQKPVLLDWRRVRENVLLPVEIAGVPKRQKRGRADELLQLLGLERFANHYPRQLSGGMQQRVSIARTLIMDPTVLLMDEPFGALDAITREQLNIELLNIWSRQRSTCLFVTHDIPEAVLLSDRVFLMTRRPGRIKQVFEIALPRPRTLEMRYSEEFTAQAREIKYAMMANLEE
jgi:NitT/TauT family transport system ATP-binding protein